MSSQIVEQLQDLGVEVVWRWVRGWGGVMGWGDGVVDGGELVSNDGWGHGGGASLCLLASLLLACVLAPVRNKCAQVPRCTGVRLRAIPARRRVVTIARWRSTCHQNVQVTNMLPPRELADLYRSSRLVYFPMATVGGKGCGDEHAGPTSGRGGSVQEGGEGAWGVVERAQEPSGALPRLDMQVYVGGRRRARSPRSPGVRRRGMARRRGQGDGEVQGRERQGKGEGGARAKRQGALARGG